MQRASSRQASVLYETLLPAAFALPNQAMLSDKMLSDKKCQNMSPVCHEWIALIARWTGAWETDASSVFVADSKEVREPVARHTIL